MYDFSTLTEPQNYIDVLKAYMPVLLVVFVAIVIAGIVTARVGDRI